MKLWATAVSLLLLGAPMAARAAEPDVDAAQSEAADPVVRGLEQRNSERDAAFDEAAAASERGMAARTKRATAEQEDHKAADTATRKAWDEDVHRAKVGAQRKTGMIVLGAGAAALAGGVAAVLGSASLQASIPEGGFATGNDMHRTMSWAEALNGLGYTFIPLGGAALLTGLGFLVFVPGSSTRSAAANNMGGVLAW
jgi:hypothetical protein